MDAEKLLAIHSILHLLFHRNKNQHGNTKWWKWLATLKRTTLKLAMSIDRLPYVGDQYKHYLAHNIIPKCYLVFSTVVADGQFSTLGTVLLATLARLAKVTGIHKVLRKPARTGDIAPTLGRSNKCIKEDTGTIILRSRQSPGPLILPDHGDLNGLGRMTGLKNTRSLPSSSQGCEDTDKKNQTQKKTKKKKRKDAIDDLFDSLL
ncbi:uncharacterized protein BO97DRAFT_408730 [Aspergillus homomorphus CBS 101889]|uniref:RNase MRP protein 1 RNA binding domain-containing protein n=1 Tax=Aspergillus homomorphus (strain CBS 101889) TaxID=1450537 RepID=A0A395HII4_ASPHC|nr:hypothetical protein BO97DRAFT_408730 [Aspergillus homomorphus CBS 101889]RAL07721.1 hypothetical protein BO97DRAFT_408730 [Aspergillus homomorphus CBS 101889]